MKEMILSLMFISAMSLHTEETQQLPLPATIHVEFNLENKMKDTQQVATSIQEQKAKQIALEEQMKEEQMKKDAENRSRPFYALALAAAVYGVRELIIHFPW